MQQGDPLGPFFFALALQPALKNAAKHTMVMAYLDDVYLVGNAHNVRRGFEALVRSCELIGLTCNKSKCWSTTQIFKDVPVAADPQVLGAHLDAFSKVPKSAAPSKLIKQISELPDPQVALLLLRYAHNTRLSFLLRVMSPSATEDICHRTMAKSRACLAKLLELEYLPESCWSQALLPRGPGLGLDNLPRLAPFAFAASLQETSWRLPTLDEFHFGGFQLQKAWCESHSELVQAWNSSKELVSKLEGRLECRAAKLQKIFAHDLKKTLIDEFLVSSKSPDHNIAIVRSTLDSPIASQFLNTIPTERGLSLFPTQMRTAVRLLIGAPIDLGIKNCICGQSMDSQASHALSCKRGGGMIMRHDMLKRFFEKMCKAACISTYMEPRQFFPDDNKKPDLVLYHQGPQGRDIAIDFSLLNPTSPGAVKKAMKDGQKLLEGREQLKFQRYEVECKKLGHIFLPSVFSVYGGTTQRNVRLVIDPIIRKISKKYFVSPNWAAPDKRTYWYQRLSIALWNSVTTNIKRYQRLNHPLDA